MKVKIEPSIAKGEIKAPPSKSYAHRYLMAAALANGKSVIEGVISSDDMEATVKCANALGVSIKRQNDTVTVVSSGAIPKTENREFYCNESGSTLRFFIPIALALGGKSTFYGTERLISRGISVYEDICKEQNITVEKSTDKIAFNGKLHPSVFNARGDISSQFITGLLFALPILNGDSTVNITTDLESGSYIDITIDVLSRFGIEIKRENNTFYVKGNQEYKGTNICVEGDMSNGAFLDAFNILGGNVSVIGLNPESKQGDSVYKIIMEMLRDTTPEVSLKDCPDLAPVLFAIAGACNGGKFSDTKRLKIKESDRATAMAKELKKFGISVDILENSVTVHKGELKAPTEALCGHNDHRIVMALSVISTIYGGEIEGCQAVKKSYPHFFEDIRKIGVKLEVYDENN